MLEVVQHDQQARSASQAPSSSRAGGGLQGHGQGLGHGNGQQVGYAVGVVRLTPARATTAAPSANPGASRSAAPGRAGTCRPARRPGSAAARLPLDQRRHPIQVVLAADQAGVWTAGGAPCSGPLRSPPGATPGGAGSSTPGSGPGAGSDRGPGGRGRGRGADALGEPDRLRDGSTPSSSARTWRQVSNWARAAARSSFWARNASAAGGLLRQRVERQHAAGQLDPGGRVAPAGGVVGQPGQPGHGQPAQVLAFALGPFLELGASAPPGRRGSRPGTADGPP